MTSNLPCQKLDAKANNSIHKCLILAWCISIIWKHRAKAPLVGQENERCIFKLGNSPDPPSNTKMYTSTQAVSGMQLRPLTRLYPPTTPGSYWVLAARQVWLWLGSYTKDMVQGFKEGKEIFKEDNKQDWWHGRLLPTGPSRGPICGGCAKKDWARQHRPRVSSCKEARATAAA